MPRDRDDVRVLRLLTLLLRHRTLVVTVPAVVAVVFAAGALLVARTWTTRVSFLPTSSSTTTSALSGLAAQFGVTLPADQPGASPAFYADLVGSQRMLRLLVADRYAVTWRRPWWKGGGTERREDPLWVLLDLAEADDSARGMDEGIRYLGKHLQARTSRESGLVTVTAQMPSPELAAAVLAGMLTRVSDFNQKVRQSQASAERRFAETRVAEARVELRQAEDRLEAFLQRNRSFQNSPDLAFQHDRLSREVEMRQMVVTSLLQGYEQARIEEVRNTPLITIVDTPAPPVRPDSRGLLLRVIAVYLVMAVLGLSWAMLGQLLDSARTSDPAAGLAFDEARARPTWVRRFFMRRAGGRRD